jgi:formamidopyrimidine-DNA glycosylase
VPELPEVETVRRGIALHVCGKTIERIHVRDGRLRQPVPTDLPKKFQGALIRHVCRRAKYLLFDTDKGWLLLHLGMSGSLRLVDASCPAQKHDHIDVVLEDGHILRFCDPRRFGLLLWTAEDPAIHPLLNCLGPEPLDSDFTGDALWHASRRRTLAIKSFIMDSRIVVGVGNIYASEALFRARIRPDRAVNTLKKSDFTRLVEAIKTVLAEAIAAGGTTLRDFVDGSGRPGYFRIQLQVYGREGEPCPKCNQPVSTARIGQRSSFFCRRCQK